MIKKALFIIMVFMLGVIASSFYAILTGAPVVSANQESATGFTVFSQKETGKDIASPKDRITEDQILVYGDRVILDIKDTRWASFTPTRSMDPIIDAGANAIEIIPSSEDEIEVRDIVAYESQYAKGVIIHRVVHKEKDEQGTYFVMKGDNNPTSDPGKVRFEQIKRVVVAIIY